MSIELDDSRFHQIVFLTLGKDPSLETYETRALIAIAQLAAWGDLAEDAEERALLDRTITHLCVHGGIDPDSVQPLSRIPFDDEERISRIGELADDLERVGVRELAYVLAYLLIVADHQLARPEARLLEDFQRALAVPEGRATELVREAARIVTPAEVLTAEARPTS